MILIWYKKRNFYLAYDSLFCKHTFFVILQYFSCHTHFFLTFNFLTNNSLTYKFWCNQQFSCKRSCQSTETLQLQISPVIVLSQCNYLITFFLESVTTSFSSEKCGLMEWCMAVRPHVVCKPGTITKITAYKAFNFNM